MIFKLKADEQIKICYNIGNVIRKELMAMQETVFEKSNKAVDLAVAIAIAGQFNRKVVDYIDVTDKNEIQKMFRKDKK